MTVLLFQPSPTEKLLKRSKFSAVLWIRYRRRLESGGKRSTLGRDRRSAEQGLQVQPLGLLQLWGDAQNYTGKKNVAGRSQRADR